MRICVTLVLTVLVACGTVEGGMEEEWMEIRKDETNGEGQHLGVNPHQGFTVVNRHEVESIPRAEDGFNPAEGFTEGKSEPIPENEFHKALDAKESDTLHNLHTDLSTRDPTKYPNFKIARKAIQEAKGDMDKLSWVRQMTENAKTQQDAMDAIYDALEKHSRESNWDMVENPSYDMSSSDEAQGLGGGVPDRIDQ